MLSIEELQKPRSPNELWLYVRNVFESTRKNSDLVKVARLRKGLFRTFAQELYPLSIFCKWKYRDADVLCQLVLGNQGYDAEIHCWRIGLNVLRLRGRLMGKRSIGTLYW